MYQNSRSGVYQSSAKTLFQMELPFSLPSQGGSPHSTTTTTSSSSNESVSSSQLAQQQQQVVTTSSSSSSTKIAQLQLQCVAGTLNHLSSADPSVTSQGGPPPTDFRAFPASRECGSATNFVSPSISSMVMPPAMVQVEDLLLLRPSWGSAMSSSVPAELPPSSVRGLPAKHPLTTLADAVVTVQFCINSETRDGPPSGAATASSQGKPSLKLPFQGNEFVSDIITHRLLPSVLTIGMLPPSSSKTHHSSSTAAAAAAATHSASQSLSSVVFPDPQPPTEGHASDGPRRRAPAPPQGHTKPCQLVSVLSDMSLSLYGASHPSACQSASPPAELSRRLLQTWIFPFAGRRLTTQCVSLIPTDSSVAATASSTLSPSSERPLTISARVNARVFVFVGLECGDLLLLDMEGETIVARVNPSAVGSSSSGGSSGGGIMSFLSSASSTGAPDPQVVPSAPRCIVEIASGVQQSAGNAVYHAALQCLPDTPVVCGDADPCSSGSTLLNLEQSPTSLQVAPSVFAVGFDNGAVMILRVACRALSSRSSNNEPIQAAAPSSKKGATSGVPRVEADVQMVRLLQDRFGCRPIQCIQPSLPSFTSLLWFHQKSMNTSSPSPPPPVVDHASAEGIPSHTSPSASSSALPTVPATSVAATAAISRAPAVILLLGVPIDNNDTDGMPASPQQPSPQQRTWRSWLMRHLQRMMGEKIASLDGPYMALSCDFGTVHVVESQSLQRVATISGKSLGCQPGEWMTIRWLHTRNYNRPCGYESLVPNALVCGGEGDEVVLLNFLHDVRISTIASGTNKNEMVPQPLQPDRTHAATPHHSERSPNPLSSTQRPTTAPVLRAALLNPVLELLEAPWAAITMSKSIRLSLAQRLSSVHKSWIVSVSVAALAAPSHVELFFGRSSSWSSASGAPTSPPATHHPIAKLQRQLILSTTTTTTTTAAAPLQQPNASSTSDDAVSAAVATTAAAAAVAPSWKGLAHERMPLVLLSTSLDGTTAVWWLFEANSTADGGVPGGSASSVAAARRSLAVSNNSSAEEGEAGGGLLGASAATTTTTSALLHPSSNSNNNSSGSRSRAFQTIHHAASMSANSSTGAYPLQGSSLDNGIINEGLQQQQQQQHPAMMYCRLAEEPLKVLKHAHGGDMVIRSEVLDALHPMQAPLLVTLCTRGVVRFWTMNVQ